MGLTVEVVEPDSNLWQRVRRLHALYEVSLRQGDRVEDLRERPGLVLLPGLGNPIRPQRTVERGLAGRPRSGDLPPPTSGRLRGARWVTETPCGRSVRRLRRPPRRAREPWGAAPRYRGCGSAWPILLPSV
jgi:hypothetical protein